MKSAIGNSRHAYDFGNAASFLAEMPNDPVRLHEENSFSPLDAENELHSSLQHFTVEKTRGGMAVVMLNLMPSTLVLPKVQLDAVQLAFFSLYSGRMNVTWEGRKRYGSASFTPGNYVVACSAGNYSISMKPEAPCKAVGVVLTPETLRAILGPDDAHSIALSRVHPDAEGVSTCWEDSMPSAQASLAGSQLLGCAMTGKGRQLYLKGKSTELLSVYLDMLQGQRLGFDGFSRDDMQKLYDARTVLVERMADPPGIFELSRLCCTNEFKLKKGFKKVFSQTVFEVLRKERMARAKRLIEEGRYSVSNAAYEVGYSSVSKFIAAFKGEYGTTPGSLSFKKR